MFQIGDIVFYPDHGVGEIDLIEEKIVGGIKKRYYCFHLLNNPMKVYLPIDIVENVNVRLISDSDGIDAAIEDAKSHLNKASSLLLCNYKDRREKFSQKIKKGTTKEYLDVVFMLTKLKRQHNLNTSERQILYKAKKIIIEEICISKKLSKDEASEFLECSISV